MDEPIELTLNALLNNPTGKQTSYMASRARIIADLEARYESLLKKYKKFPFRIFKLKNSFVFIFKIPSETFDDFFYDVVIQFEPTTPEMERDSTLNRYKLYLFSNSPSFTFTYTYVVSDNDMLVDFVRGKCSKVALSEAPKIRNPVEVYGFEKSCYYACKYIRDMGVHKKFSVEGNLFLFNKLKVLSSISSQEEKLKEYNKLKEKQKKGKVKKKKSTTAKKATSKKKS